MGRKVERIVGPRLLARHSRGCNTMCTGDMVSIGGEQEGFTRDGEFGIHVVMRNHHRFG